MVRAAEVAARAVAEQRQPRGASEQWAGRAWLGSLRLGGWVAEAAVGVMLGGQHAWRSRGRVLRKESQTAGGLCVFALLHNCASCIVVNSRWRKVRVAPFWQRHVVSKQFARLLYVLSLHRACRVFLVTTFSTAQCHTTAVPEGT